MAKYEKTIYVPQDLLNMVNKHLTVEPTCREECFGEDNTISVTAKFDNGIEMDIKCCGVQYSEDESNLAWTEAVLFDHGNEICCTDPADEFDGVWELSHNGNSYIVNVIPAREIKLTKVVIEDGCNAGNVFATFYLVNPEVGPLCELQDMIDAHKWKPWELCDFITENFEVADINREIIANF